ncbi:MAG: metallophosphoesterase [Firmicutes bacterium]|nr:metallophosphoesterase [Bacillota bacterium]
MAIFILIAIIFYVGWRGRQAFDRYIPRRWGTAVYWVVYLLIATSYIVVDRMNLPVGSAVKSAAVWVGPYTIAFMFYAFWVLLLIDILRLLDWKLKFIPSVLKQNRAWVGAAAILLILGILGYGTWNARNPVVTSYQLQIPKTVSGDKQLHAVVLSDLHLGRIIDRERLEHIIAQVNKLNPDIVLLAGDVIDGDARPYIEQDMGSVFRQLQPRLGTYMVLGNHDNMRNDDTIKVIQDSGIILLRDQYRLIDNRFYLVGRNYPSRGFVPGPQPKLASVMAGIDRQLPIIMLKHNPQDLEEARTNQVDLQISGHTHQGQLYPLHLITERMYEIDWGHLQKDGFQLIVSTGVGTWGPPIRVGNTPEIVDLRIEFN